MLKPNQMNQKPVNPDQVNRKQSQQCANSRRSGSSIALAVLFATFLALPASADSGSGAAKTAVDPSSGTNIFSTPDTQGNEAPSFAEDQTAGGKVRKALFGTGKDGVPGFQQVRTIPSLTQVQRKEIQRLYNDAKDHVEPLVEQLKQLRDPAGGEDQKNAMLDPDKRAKFQQLRTQIRDIRQQTWDRVKAGLSDQQIQELESMKKGEFQPATFNEPRTGAGDLRAMMGADANQEKADGGQFRRRMQQHAGASSGNNTTADPGQSSMQMQDKGDN